MGKSSKRDKRFNIGAFEFQQDSNSSFNNHNLPKKAMTTSMYFSDPLLIPRINQYLSDNKDKVYVDINDMVSELQSKYRDYARRKRNAFKPLVEKAFSFVLQQCGMGKGDGTFNNFQGSSENSSSEVEECHSGNEGNNTSSNSQLVKLYNATQLEAMSKQYQTNFKENAELIDLSSDDENVKKKDGEEEKNENTNKLNNLQNRLGNKDTSVFVVKQPGVQNVKKINKPFITITAKRSRDAVDSKSKPKFLLKKKPQQTFVFKPSVTFSDFGGDTKVLEEVCKLILHISHPEIYREIGISPPRGFLLHGPPGCGKTLLATAIAGELGVELIQVSAPELIGGVSGESEERIRDLFERAIVSAPCVLFIDEVDAITPNRQNAQREMERRIVAQLLTCLDELNTKPNGDLVLVIGATNRPDSLDPALRRAGRFDREVCLGIPDLKAREKILRVLCSNLNLAPDFCYEEVAQNTPGFVGADLLALTREAAMVAINRVFGVLQSYQSQERHSRNKRLKISHPEPSGEEKGGNEKEESMEVDIIDTPKKDKPEEVKSSEDSEKNLVQNVDSSTSSGDSSEKKNETINESTGNTNKEPDTTEGTSSQRNEETDEKVESSKNVESEDEIDVEVIDENAVATPPTLETLMHWVRDGSPLTCRQLKNVCITQENFNQALSSVQPSSKREGFATVPDVTWDDIGSLADIREELKMSILGPVKYRKQFEQLGLTAPAGILICGPPGCGKTLLAKAVANEAGVNFISVKGPELLNMYVGESERAVRRCFQRARNSAPCVIFFDELDALCPRRSDSSENGASMRVVNQLLTEMDGVEDRKEVYLMAATNRPDIIDPAVLRPGRLDKILYVGLPQAEDRVDILRALTKNGTRPKLDKDVKLSEIGMREECNGYSGADLAALVREAGVQALKELMSKPETDANADVVVSLEHFEKALKKIRPSVSPEDRKYYESLKKKYTTSKV